VNDLYVKALALQNLLISHVTGCREDEAEYARLRQMLLANYSLESLMPQFLRTCRNLTQFWQLIKYQFSTYAERRIFIWGEFNPLLEALERGAVAPSDETVTQTLKKFDAVHIQAAWSKALERRSNDPEGAITTARTLLEEVCKYILDESGAIYEDSSDLPKLYKQTAELLRISPSQYSEQAFKRILGGCISVVEGLGSLRNRLGDAHGKGKVGTKPAPRHAELAVNLSGVLATYILATWIARSE